MFAPRCSFHAALHQLPVAVTCTPIILLCCCQAIVFDWRLCIAGHAAHTEQSESQCSDRVAAAGAPRTGNHAFARVYMQHVPDTWHMINNQVGLHA